MMSPVLFRNIFVLFFIIYSVNLKGQDGWSEPIILNYPYNYSRGYSAVVDDQGVIYLVYGQGISDIYKNKLVLKTSTDNGETWSEAQDISDTNSTLVDPVIDVDSKGYLHVLYKNMGENKIFYITSENNWATSIPVSGVSGSNPRIVIDKKDIVHFIWTIWYYDLVEHRYRSGGILSDTESVSDSTVDAAYNDVALDNENNLHVVFVGYPDDYTYKIFYRKLSQNIWSEIEEVASSHLDLRESAITTLDDIPLIVWNQTVQLYPPELKENIFYSKKDSTWSNPEAIDTLTISYRPNIITDKYGTAHCVWTKRTYGFSQNDSLYYSFYKNNIWSGAQKINFILSPPLTTAGARRCISTYGDNLFLFFIQIILGKTDLYFSRRSTLVGIKDQQHELPDNLEFFVYPNPFNSEANIRYRLNTSGRTEIILYDILGKEIRTILDEEQTTGVHNFSISSNGLASGVYFCRLKNNNRNIYKKLLILK